jgi:hypothetical protein
MLVLGGVQALSHHSSETTDLNGKSGLGAAAMGRSSAIVGNTPIARCDPAQPSPWLCDNRPQ